MSSSASGGGGAGPETVLDSSPGGAKGGVSQKIQQLLNTLKRPKKNRRPIEEYYQDQDPGERERHDQTCSTVVEVFVVTVLGNTSIVTL